MDLIVADDSPALDGLLVIDIERFQGPFDLLLHLIRTQDVDIFDIPIARITDQFLQAIRGLEATDLDGAGEFLEMAAALIHIKVQMLLPRPADDEDGDPRAELVRRLLEYEQIREVSLRLRAAEADRGRKRGKGYVPPRRRKAVTEMPLETTWDEVFAAALLVEMPVPHDREHRVTTRKVTMEEKSVLILDALKKGSRIEFHRLLDGFRDRSHGVMTLLAGLELTRRGMLLLRQARPFSELWLYRRDENKAVETSLDEAHGDVDAAETDTRTETDTDTEAATAAGLDVDTETERDDEGVAV